MWRISSSLNKRKLGEAQHDGDRVVIKKRQSVSMDMEVLHCPVCFQILRPPVFQCDLGHLMCSPCRDNLPAGGKCPSPSCSGTPSVRCVAMERVVNSVEVACAYAEHGCPDKIAYANITEHEKTCPHAPCFCPEPGCGFAAASAAALADHFTAPRHNWPSHKLSYSQPFELRVHPGKNVLVGEEDGALFLLNVSPAAEHAVVSLFSVQPHHGASGFGRSASHFGCSVEFSCFLGHLQCSTLVTVTSSSLSDGMPEEWFFSVPELQDSVDGDAGVGVDIRITIDEAVPLFSCVDGMEDDDDEDCDDDVDANNGDDDENDGDTSDDEDEDDEDGTKLNFLGHCEASTLEAVKISSLSDGLPKDRFFSVPKQQDGDAGVVLGITIDDVEDVEDEDSDEECE
uniref:RING-type E3 ubiquitin transferase n=1 Tax=Oryza nivara TaxID=4536 RepID=A0A0E0FFL3_ORYNI